MFSLRDEYSDIDAHSINWISKGSYYMFKFRVIKMRYLLKLTSNRVDFSILTRIITGYSGTISYLFKISVSEFFSCRCG